MLSFQAGNACEMPAGQKEYFYCFCTEEGMAQRSHGLKEGPEVQASDCPRQGRGHVFPCTLLLCFLRNSGWPMEEITLRELEPQRCSESFPASSTHPTPHPAWALHSPFSGNSSVQHGVPVDFMGQPQADKWRRKTSPWSPLASQNLTSAQPEGRWAVLTQCGR